MDVRKFGIDKCSFVLYYFSMAKVDFNFLSNWLFTHDQLAESRGKEGNRCMNHCHVGNGCVLQQGSKKSSPTMIRIASLVSPCGGIPPRHHVICARGYLQQSRPQKNTTPSKRCPTFQRDQPGDESGRALGYGRCRYKYQAKTVSRRLHWDLASPSPVLFHQRSRFLLSSSPLLRLHRIF